MFSSKDECIFFEYKHRSKLKSQAQESFLCFGKLFLGEVQNGRNVFGYWLSGNFPFQSRVLNVWFHISLSSPGSWMYGSTAHFPVQGLGCVVPHVLDLSILLMYQLKELEELEELSVCLSLVVVLLWDGVVAVSF